jgi:hypothetical protein
MSAGSIFTKNRGDGGLTSSSDARAHQAIALRTFLVQALVVMAAFLLSTLRGTKKSKNKLCR